MKENNTAGITRLQSFFDDGTFVELGAYIRRPGDEDRLEGVVCGYGSLGGRLVFAFAQDSSSMKGALDGRHAEKIVRTYEKALSVGAPIVGFFDCAGAVVFDGAAALAGYGTLLRTVSDASGKIPQIAVISGTCAGTMASVAALFDLTVTIKDVSRLYVASPTLVGEGVGTAAYAFEHGNAAILADTEDEAKMAVRKLLSYLPDNAGHGIPAVARSPCILPSSPPSPCKSGNAARTGILFSHSVKTPPFPMERVTGRFGSPSAYHSPDLEISTG
jgi:acetyl-CoA carboxylase carboxyltransferase component